MKNIILSTLCAVSLHTASAEVLPEQAGAYLGTFSTLSMDTVSEDKLKYKTEVLCTVEQNGTTIIRSVDPDEGLYIEGNMNSGPRYGFFFAYNQFLTQTGIMQFKKSGKLSGDLQYGVTPGGNMTFIVKGKLKLKKTVLR